VRDLLASLLLGLLVAIPSQMQALENDKENILYIDLKDGRVAIQLRPDLAPGYVARVKQLAREGFYDGLLFHRVIDGFMAQTGDPLATGVGGSAYPDLEAEFSNEPFVRGTVGAARTRDPNSANSQFFIVLEEASHLDGKYTVWGQVIRGMERVDAIRKGDPAQNGLVSDPDQMLRVQVAADAADHSVMDEPRSPGSN
jgi:peptidylprolyl isomerase